MGSRRASMIFRVRQHQMDEADVAEVVRHLVDEERAARAAVRPRIGQEAFAEAHEIRRVSSVSTPG
jgi:hypothetical protein